MHVFDLHDSDFIGKVQSEKVYYGWIELTNCCLVKLKIFKCAVLQRLHYLCLRSHNWMLLAHRP